MATEHSKNDGSKAQYYVVILDRLQDCSGGLEQAPESRIRGPLTGKGEKRKYSQLLRKTVRNTENVLVACCYILSIHIF